MNLKQRYKFVLYKFTDSHLCWQYAHNAETTSCELWLPFLSGDLCCCCCWVTQSCLISWPPWTAAHQAPLSFMISRSLLQLMSIELVMLSNHLILCRPFPFCFQSFPPSGSFPMDQFFASGGKNIGVSVSAPVFPIIIQDWSPLGWTGWISLQSKGLSRVFSNTKIRKYLVLSVLSSVLSLLYGPTLTSIHDHWKNRSFD